jgi:hypothetical protein
MSFHTSTERFELGLELLARAGKLLVVLLEIAQLGTQNTAGSGVDNAFFVTVVLLFCVMGELYQRIHSNCSFYAFMIVCLTAWVLIAFTAMILKPDSESVAPSLSPSVLLILDDRRVRSVPSLPTCVVKNNCSRAK